MQIGATGVVSGIDAPRARPRLRTREPERPRPDLDTLVRALANAWDWDKLLPERLELGTFSRAGGSWNVDWAEARADAIRTLRSIDFAQRDIVIWAPGTDGKGVHTDFKNAVNGIYHGRDVSLTHLHYDASWDLRSSLPTGLATMKLVLEGIRQRLAAMPAAERPRVLLGGLSQGAWIIGEAIADPRVGSVVTRAITAGHPWLAKTQYTNGHDPRVRVINHNGDQITMTVKGDAGVGMDAMAAVKTGKFGEQFGTVVKAILANPLQGVLLLHTMVRDSAPWLRPYLRDAHVYGGDMWRMVDYLRTGTLVATDEELDDRKHGRRT